MEKKNIINWEKIGEYTKKVGKVSTRPLLLLYYVLKSPDTPTSDKFLIFFKNLLLSIADSSDFCTAIAHYRMD